MKDDILKLKRDVESLRASFFTNNFATSKDENKYVRFNTALKVPSYSSLPASCEQGEVVESSGTLYICSATDTWNVVGTQT